MCRCVLGRGPIIEPEASSLEVLCSGVSVCTGSGCEPRVERPHHDLHDGQGHEPTLSTLFHVPHSGPAARFTLNQ